MGRKLEVDLVANARPFNNTLDAAVGKVTGFSSRLKAMGGGSIGKGLAIGAGVAGFNLLTSSIGIAVSKMDEMHQAFLDDEASQVRLQNVLKNSVTNYEAATKAVEDYAQAQLDMGFDDADTRDSVGQLVGVTKDYTEAIKLSGLASDIARSKNIDLAQATDIVTKAYNGQARGLAAIGVNVQGAVGGTQLLARAFQNVRGAQEAYANTGAGRVARANVRMQETMEKVGKVIDEVSKVVIPIMVDGLSELVDLAGDFIGIFTQVADFVAGRLSAAFALFGENVAGTAGWLATLRDVGKTILNGILPGSVGLGGGATNPNGSPLPPGVTVTKYPPFHHQGGIVAGPYGSDQLIMAQAGERITPLGEKSGQTIIVNIASFIGSDRDIDRFSDRLAFRLRSTSLS